MDMSKTSQAHGEMPAMPTMIAADTETKEKQTNHEAQHDHDTTKEEKHEDEAEVKQGVWEQ